MKKNMDARPDQEEMEQAISKFLQRLEKKGFKDLATLLSHLPKPAQVRLLHVCGRGYGSWFSPST